MSWSRLDVELVFSQKLREKVTRSSPSILPLVTHGVQTLRHMVSSEKVQIRESGAVSNDVELRTTSKSTSVSGTVSCSLLNRCRLVAPLGRGGMAEVFLAACEVSPTEQYPVVIKRLYSHFGDDPLAVQMLHDEARLVSSLSHHNIVKLYEIGELDDHHCLVMEYLEGQPLQRLMHRNGKRTVLPVDVAVYIVLKTLEALEYAHDAKDRNNKPLCIIHRDISPQNVFVTNDGCVKLLDFGIAKATSHEGRTVTGLVKGKFAYIAPEQALAQPIDGRADLWSVGVILWELISGRRLFKADNEAATLRATLRADVPRLSTLRSNVALELERIVGRALQRHPSLRYRSATEMKNDLIKYLRIAGTKPDTSSLAQLMQTQFVAEIAAQQQLVKNLASSDYTKSTVPHRTTQVTSSTISSTSDTYDINVLMPTDSLKPVDMTVRLGQKAWFAGLLAAVVVGASVMVLALTASKNTGTTSGVEGTRAPQVSPRPIEPLLVTKEKPSQVKSNGLPETVAANALPTAATGQTRTRPNRSQTVENIKFSVKSLLPAKEASPVAATVEVATGYLTLDTSPWSLVSVKGKSLGQTPIIGAKLPIGNHVLVLRNPDIGIETSYSVSITEGNTTTKRIGLQ